jgi:hypothetical protein
MVGVLFVQILLHLIERGRGPAWRACTVLASAIVFGVLISFAWPGFEVPVGTYVSVHEDPPFGKTPFADMANLYWLALPCAVWFAIQRTRARLFLLAGFVATHGALIALRALHIEYGHRYAFFEAFFAQAAVAEVAAIGLGALLERGREVLRWRYPRDAIRAAVPIGFMVSTMIVAFGSPEAAYLRAGVDNHVMLPRELLQQPSAHETYYGRLGAIAARLSAEDRVMMHAEREAWDIASITGARVVASPFAYRAADFEERLADVDRFFATDVSTEQAEAIIRRYHITKIVLTEKHIDLAPEMIRRYGPPEEFDTRFILFEPR